MKSIQVQRDNGQQIKQNVKQHLSKVETRYNFSYNCWDWKSNKIQQRNSQLIQITKGRHNHHEDSLPNLT